MIPFHHFNGGLQFWVELATVHRIVLQSSKRRSPLPSVSAIKTKRYRMYMLPRIYLLQGSFSVISLPWPKYTFSRQCQTPAKTRLLASLLSRREKRSLPPNNFPKNVKARRRRKSHVVLCTPSWRGRRISPKKENVAFFSFIFFFRILLVETESRVILGFVLPNEVAGEKPRSLRWSIQLCLVSVSHFPLGGCSFPPCKLLVSRFRTHPASLLFLFRNHE
jgi:hypothetical protein